MLEHVCSFMLHVYPVQVPDNILDAAAQNYCIHSPPSTRLQLQPIHGHPNQQNDAQHWNTMNKVMKNNLIELVTNANIRATCKSEE